MHDHLKSLELGLVQLETHLIKFLFYILRPGDFVPGFDPRRVESGHLRSSLRGRVLLALLSDPDVKSAVGGDACVDEKSLPRLDTQAGLDEFFG